MIVGLIGFMWGTVGFSRGDYLGEGLGVDGVR